MDTGTWSQTIQECVDAIALNLIYSPSGAGVTDARGSGESNKHETDLSLFTVTV